MSTSLDASSSAPASTPHNRGRLLQVLGVWFGIAAAIGNTIAAGIVRTPGDVAEKLPNPWLYLGVWLLGGAYALVGASSMAELGAMIPRSGGQYNFARRGVGEYAGFLVGWSDWLSTCGTNAAVAIVIGEYGLGFVDRLHGHFPLLFNYVTALGPASRSLLTKEIAVSVLLFFAILQWRGVKWGSGAQLITAALKTGAFIVVVVACFLIGGHLREAAASPAAAQPAIHFGWPFITAFLIAVQAVVYTVDGWDGVIYFGAEVKNPGRDVPRAIFGSVFSIMAIYLLLNAAVLYVLPMNQIAGNNFALGTAANRIFGHLGDPVIRLIMIVSLLSCINACQMFAARTLFAMSGDRLFFKQASRVNKGGTPVTALLLSTVVGIVFILGSFERVIAMLSFFFVANYTLSYASLFRLRKREPDLPRPYRAWGYPWTSGVALAASGMFLIASLATDRENAPLAFIILAVSYPIYRVMKWAAVVTDKPAVES
ncbi:MAG TPA: APC family permease [Candidatus Acidoferrum sp.]|nr:APC family permease [Candidatus Acidoferrum sp.]